MEEIMENVQFYIKVEEIHSKREPNMQRSEVAENMKFPVSGETIMLHQCKKKLHSCPLAGIYRISHR